ncbi:hypothetical protein P3T76_011108 [Phytophthora citrophthora]|uniref:Uncharacterized protein n=1 Tax=Phytophthora citrophthora TaxID=4793 RepID=A0AAD9G9Y9_9STRA|nr:hypothetical protein P3T76_011108 [Phytophthora citrophthora]
MVFVFTMNSFIRPVLTEPKKSSGFNFMTFQPKLEKLITETGIASNTPFLKKLSVGSLRKKSNTSSAEAGSTTNKEASLKPQEKAVLPFAFRGTSTAKKRKAESPVNEDRKSGFPSKIGRGDSSFTVRNPTQSKGKGKQPVKNTQRGISLQSNAAFTAKMGRVKVSNGNVLKKRSLLEAAATISAPKRSKLSTHKAVGEHGDSSKVANGADANSSFGDEDLSSPPIPSTTCEQIRASPKADSDGAKNAELTHLSSTESPSPDNNEDGLNEIGEFLAMKRFCSLDDDKEDDFLIRAVAVQEFTDRVGLEQKQLRNRLLDAHDVSESLLDALTVLLAEEGGIGIDKLAFNMDIDVDVGNAFLQENDIQAIE